MKITELLISEFGFRGISERREDEIDYNKFSCVLRVHDLHYLFYSEDLKHFTIGLRSEFPKGEAGVKGKKYWSYMMIPKVIQTTEDAVLLVNGTVNFDYLKVICQ